MAINDFLAESPLNYEQKCLCVLLLDTSGSMVGEGIRELNKGLEEFYYQVVKDEVSAERLEVCVITFESQVKCVQEPILVRNLKLPVLEANGSTQLAEGILQAILKVENRKHWYRKTGQSYYRPFIILITDGSPDGDQDMEKAMFEINEGVNERKFLFFPIGVKDADMETLRKISHPSTPPMRLDGVKFVEFFKWLSNSVSVITNSKDSDKIRLPDTTSWGQISLD